MCVLVVALALTMAIPIRCGNREDNSQFVIMCQFFSDQFGVWYVYALANCFVYMPQALVIVVCVHVIYIYI